MNTQVNTEKMREGDEAAHPQPIQGRTALFVLGALLLLAALVAASGILPRLHAAKVLAQETNANAAPQVVANLPAQGSPMLDLVLPGNIYAYVDSPIFARSDGYLQKWNYDIGAHVHKGALLATISAPELDQQVIQAKADLQTARTNAGIASVTAGRYKDLLPSAAVSKQETDTAVSQAESGTSSVNAAQANLQRLLSLQVYEKVYAPFDGIVTARNVDVGQLINSGANGGAASQLFHMAAVNTLRVYVAVPQAYGDAAKPGVQAAMTFNEYPGKEFPVKVTRAAGYIDPTSRTLLVELDYSNTKSHLTPGSFVQVHFHLKSGGPTLRVPASALMFRSEGLRVGTVVNSAAGTPVAKLRPVILGEDDGRVVQVVHGLEPGSEVIQNPPDSLIDGEPVSLVPAQAPAKSAGGASHS